MVISKQFNGIVKCVLLMSILLLTLHVFKNRWYQKQDKKKIQVDRLAYKLPEVITLERLHHKIWNQIIKLYRYKREIAKRRK